MTSPTPEPQGQQTAEQAAAQQAGQQAANDLQRQAAAGELTPQQFLDKLDSLPDKIVEALKTAYPASTPGSGKQESAGNDQGQQNTGGQESSSPGGPWFGHKTFADFWGGSK